MQYINNLEGHVDYDIIKQVINGDKNAFDALIEKYYNEIFKFVYNQLNDIETAKNVVQEICMRIYVNLKKYNPNKASFRTWMYRVANNYCINYIRDNKKYNAVELDISTISDDTDIIKEIVITDDVSYVMSVMSNNLSKRNCKMLLLHFFSDLTQEEIAESLNLAPKTVRNIISESIGKIRDIVRRDNYDRI